MSTRAASATSGTAAAESAAGTAAAAAARLQAEGRTTLQVGRQVEWMMRRPHSNQRHSQMQQLKMLLLVSQRRGSWQGEGSHSNSSMQGT